MPNQASFLFHGSLNDFLPKARRNTQVAYAFEGAPAIKDAIEAIGVPHPEVFLILVDEVSAPFSEGLKAGNRVAVFPLTEAMERREAPLLNSLPETAKFVLDVHLGKLAKALRLLGFDTVYGTSYDDREIARIAETENRIVFTRDVGLLKQKNVKWGYWLRSQHLEEQLTEVVQRFNLAGKFVPFSRCLDCNGQIEAVEKEKVLNQLPPKTMQFFHEFYQCLNCGKVYWKGSHYDHMQAFIRKAGSF